MRDSKDKQVTEDKFLKDTSDQQLTAAVQQLQNQFSSMQDNMSKIAASLTDKDVVDEFVRDDIGQAESFKAFILERAARNADNSKMISADEKNFAKGVDNVFMKSILASEDRKQERFDQKMEQQDKLFNAYLTHYTTQHTDERVQKDAMRTPEIQGGSAIGDK